MKKIIVLLITLGISLVTIGAVFSSHNEEPNRYTEIYVNSSIEGEQVYFKGKYFNFKLSYSNEIDITKTPVKIKIFKEDFNALFKKVDGKASLNITMRIYEDGKLLSSGSTSNDVGMFIKRGDEFVVSGL